MFEPVYVTRATFDRLMVRIIPANIGIVKLYGCCYFAAAIKDKGRLNSPLCDPHEENIYLKECEKRYSSVPAEGEAWLVEEGRKYINWTRVDHNLHLLNADGSIVTSK